ncbi:MAG: hypothetical protein AAFY48_09290 [Bacteroidota bacterium]
MINVLQWLIIIQSAHLYDQYGIRLSFGYARSWVGDVRGVYLVKVNDFESFS